MNILITSAGRRVSLVRAFQMELTKIFNEGKVLTTDINPKFSAACTVSDGDFAVKRVTNPDYISELLKLCLEQEVKMIIPTIDTELYALAEQKNLFLKNGIQVIISSTDFVKKCRDKRRINEFFNNKGIEIPRPISKHDLSFPLFIKPYDGSLSVDTYLIQKQEELTNYHMTNDKLLFMEYIDKVDYDEYTVDMYYAKDNEVRCIVPRKRIEIRGGEVNKGITCKNYLISFLKERLGYIEGAVGCLTVQLFLHKMTNRVVGIEINPRFGGGFPLSFRAGANYPGWLIKEYFLGEEIDYFDSWEENLLMLRYDDEILVHDFKS
jgi:carbamoyl-phosphate synthase large subunit